MRPLEITLLLVNLLPVVWCIFTRRRPIWVQVLAWLALLIMIAQIVVEGRRWQFDPAYVSTMGLFVVLVLKRPANPSRWISVLGMGCLLVAATLSSVLPAFTYPKPSGPFPIGTVVRHLVDSSREEFLGPHPGGHRELMIQIWYPADYRGPLRSYRSRSEVSFFKEHLSLIMTNAATGVPVARTPGRYAVLIFEHSWAGRRDEDTFLVENLASHGYVVVGIDHPYGSKFTPFPDGRIVYSTLGEWMDFSSDQAQKASLRIAESQLKVRAADAIFVLDTLERLDQSDPSGLLTGHLDTSRAGLVGFSFGGGVAAEACRLDPRFRAAVNLDGCLFGESAKLGVEQPFLVMSGANLLPNSQRPDSTSSPSLRRLTFTHQADQDVRHSFETHGGYFIRIRGVSHMNFCDSPRFLPIRRMSQAGPIDVHRAERIINDYTLAFFEHSLNGRVEDFLAEAPSKYPEARLQTWQPRQGTVRSTNLSPSSRRDTPPTPQVDANRSGGRERPLRAVIPVREALENTVETILAPI